MGTYVIGTMTVSQPSMLIILAAAGTQAEATRTLTRAGHLPLPADAVAAALAAGGPLALTAERLASQCDACVIEGMAAPALRAAFHRLRRPVYPSADLVPRAEPPWQGETSLLARLAGLAAAGGMLDR